MNKLTMVLAFAALLLSSTSAFAQSTIDTNGTLGPGDPTSDDGAHYDRITIEVEAGQTILAEMSSDAFDTYLVLKAPDGQIVETNDDADIEETGTDSRLQYIAEESGTYVVLATSLFPDSSGPYTIRVLAQ